MKMYLKKCVSAFLTAAMLLSAAISAPMTASAFEIGKNPAYAARNDILSDSSSNNNGDVLANYNVGKNGKTNSYKHDVSAPSGYEPKNTEKNLTGLRITSVGASEPTAVSVKWSIKNGVLTISGNGKIEDYSYYQNAAPWSSKANSISSIVIENGITSIGTQAFCYFENVTDIRIANSVSEIGSGAFYGCSSLKSITLPDKVTVLQSGVFADCSALSSIVCNGVTSIESYAFQGTALKNFTVGKKVESLSALAFLDAPVENYTVAVGNNKYKSVNGVVYSSDSKTLVLYPSNKPGTDFIIPSTVTTVGDSAFIGNKNLVNITIPNSVKSLGSSSFQQCCKLTKIKIPDSVISAGDFTFYNCESLKSVTFGKGLETTSYMMFRECGSLSDIDFGTGLKNLYAHTFAYCYSLTEISLPKNITSIGNACFGECTGLKSFKSQALSYIPFQEFFNCTSLTDVILNEGVERIHRVAFINCINLKNITLPKSVTFVDSNAFPVSTNIVCKNPEMRKFGKNGYRYLQDITISGARSYKNAFSVLDLVNQERAKEGLSALVMNQSLMDTAMTRAGEIAVCFSHTRPDSSSCFDLNPLMIAENVACGQSTASSVMDTWMNSDGHRANILNKDAKTIGIGCFKINGSLYWVQCFGNGNDKNNCSKPSDCNVSQNISLATEEFDEATSDSGVIFGEVSSYLYDFYICLDNDSLKSKETTNAKLNLRNAGFHSFSVPVDNIGVSWSCNPNNVAVIDQNGKIIAENDGTATVKAALKYYQATETLTVKNPPVMPAAITVNPSFLGLGIGESYTLKSEISPSNAVQTVTWNSSNTSVATVSNGKVTAKKTGTAIITVKTSNGKTASCKVTVKSAPSSVKTNPTSLTLGKGETYTISESTNSGSYANAANLKWSSSDSNVATVVKGSGNKAIITAKGAGTAIIKITLYNGKTASCKVTVKSAPSSVKTNPTSLTLGKGETYTISESTNSGSYANAANLKWSSSDSNVATVVKGSGNKAIITAKGAGTAIIKITLYNGKTASCKVTVKSAPSSVKTNPTSLTLGKGETYTISESTNSVSYANAANLKWSSSDSNVATVVKGSGNKAVITAKGAGTAIIKITLYNGKTASCKVTVKSAPSSVKTNPTSLTLGKGETYTISESTNSGSYANAANLKWSSSDSNVATVVKGSGNKAIITAKGAGTAIIKITLYNGKTASCKVTVKSAPSSVKTNPTSLTLGKGETYTISESTNNGSYANAANLKWSSSDSNIATVVKGNGNKAVITAKGAGTAIIKITLYNGKTASCKVTVK